MSGSHYERKEHHYFARLMSVMLYDHAGENFNAVRFARAIIAVENQIKNGTRSDLDLKDEIRREGTVLVSNMSELFAAVWEEYAGEPVAFDQKFFEKNMKRKRTRVSSGKTVDEVIKMMDGDYGTVVVLPVFPGQWQADADNAGLEEIFEDVDPSVLEDFVASNVQRVQGADNVGGIDFNPSTLNLQIQNEGRAIEMNMDSIDLDAYRNAQGFTPVIINIQPVMNLPLFLGANQQPAETDSISAL